MRKNHRDLFLSAILICAMVLFVSGCGKVFTENDPGGAGVSTSTTTTTTTTTISDADYFVIGGLVGVLAAPSGVAVDGNGNIYVTDHDVRGAQKFDSAGNFILRMGLPGGIFSLDDHSIGVTVDNDGNTYYTTENEQIFKFDSAGNFVLKFGSYGSGDLEFRAIQGIAVDASGNIYVADTNNHRIQKFSPQGNDYVHVKTIGVTGVSGNDNDHFDHPNGVAVDASGNIYVADTNNHRIQKFSPQGNDYAHVKTIGVTGVSGNDNDHFNRPCDVAVDASGNLYVADAENNRIQKFSPQGNDYVYDKTIGSSSGGDVNEGYRCNDVAVSLDGNYIYVANKYNDCVQKYDSQGNFVLRIGASLNADGRFNLPYDSEMDKDGNIYVADSENNRIQKFDRNGNFVRKFGSYGTGIGEFKSPVGVAADPSGNIYVADAENHRVQKFDQDGVCLAQFGAEGNSDGQFGMPLDIAVDASGDVIYVLDVDGNSGSGRIQRFRFNEGVGGYDHEKTIHIANMWRSGMDGGFPDKIAVDNKGNIYLTDIQNFCIQKLDENGNRLAQFYAYADGGAFGIPCSVAVDGSGNVYAGIAAGIIGAPDFALAQIFIRKFDKNGNGIARFGSFGSSSRQFSLLSGMAVDNQGNACVTDLGNCRVHFIPHDDMGWR